MDSKDLMIAKHHRIKWNEILVSYQQIQLSVKKI